MEINKKKLDKVIEWGRKYYKAKDNEGRVWRYWYNARTKLFGRNKHWLTNIFIGLILKQDDYNEPNETYYKVLEALGFTIVEG